MPVIPFTNLMSRKKDTWNPDIEGYWLVRINDGDHIPLADGKQLSLAYGSCGNPRWQASHAFADLALILAKFSEATGKVGVFKVPCVMSNRESHILVADNAPDDILAEARHACRHFGKGSHASEDAFRNKHGNR